MRYDLAPLQEKFFRENGVISFTPLLRDEELSRLNDLPESTRNLWSTNPSFKSLSLSRSRAEIAALLFKTPSIRIAYDHLFTTPKNIYLPTTLTNTSSFQKILGGLIINLGCEGTGFLPPNLGDGTYFSPKRHIPFDEMQAPGARYLLIVYCTSTAVYYRNKRDPFTHAPKDDGYNFGDCLRESTNPKLV